MSSPSSLLAPESRLPSDRSRLCTYYVLQVDYWNYWNLWQCLALYRPRSSHAKLQGVIYGLMIHGFKRKALICCVVLRLPQYSSIPYILHLQRLCIIGSRLVLKSVPSRPWHNETSPQCYLHGGMDIGYISCLGSRRT